MRMIDLITKKKFGLSLSEEEINYWIKGVVDESIPTYQTSALLMAIRFMGMSEEETFFLTSSMMHSGEVIDLSEIPGIKVDKHSTGGVGDKTTLVLAPMVAACGCKVAKMSGRGLGHTGGTIDKLESIPGFNVSKSIEELINQVKDVGLAVIGQTNNLCPADKILYALRDVTGTVDSIPLIASSVMSKKLASGADSIVLDVTVGEGAFMQNIKDARKLADLMVRIGKFFNKKVHAVISEMNEPLGYAIGNNLEVKEAIDTLNGHGPSDLLELCLKCGSILLIDSNLAKDENEARKKLKDAISSKAALNKFKEMVKEQGGDIDYILHPEKFPKAKYAFNIAANKEGYIKEENAFRLGLLSMKFGAGREKLGDKIDFSAGIILKKKVGDFVKKNETILVLYSDKEIDASYIKKIFSFVKISPNKTKALPVIIDQID